MLCRYRGRPLFSDAATYDAIEKALADGADIITRLLTVQFGFQEHMAGRRHPLFAINPKKRIHEFSGGNAIEPEEGWRIIGTGPGEAGMMGRQDPASRTA